MSLDAKTWTPTSIHYVVLAWLQAERHDVAQRVKVDWAPLLDSPNLNDAGENRERLRVLDYPRAPRIIPLSLCRQIRLAALMARV